MDDDPDKPMAIYVKRNSRRKSVPVRIDGIGKLSLAEALLLLDNRHEGCQIKPEFSIAISSMPGVKDVKITGDIVENERVVVTGTITGGGTDGCSRAQWYKSSSQTLDESKLEALSTSTVQKAFRIPLGAVGCYLVAKYTPMSPDGVSGTPTFVISDREVESLLLKLTFIEIIGDYYEGGKVTASYGYVGGHEGKSIYNWCIYEKEDDPNSAILEDSGRLEYQFTENDVGKFILFQCTPVRSDGVPGVKRICMGAKCIHPARPSVRNVEIVGDAIEGTIIKGVGDYFGGEEGNSTFEWSRKNMETNGEGFMSVSSGTHYTLTKEDVGCCLTFSYTPINSEGRRGKKKSAVSPVVKQASPSVSNVRITGDAFEGMTINGVGDYFGGWEGHSKFEWLRHKDTGDRLLVSAGTTSDYTLTEEDVGCCLTFAYTPINSEGQEGIKAFSAVFPVVQGIPRVHNLKIEGKGFHTSVYYVDGIYSGGKQGKKRIQWFRSMEGRPDMIIPGETCIVYEANVGDVGYKLVAVYTPIREDGVEGQSVSVSTDPIAVEPDILKKVNCIVDRGSVKFEVACDRGQTSEKRQKRILDINRKRVKMVKPAFFPTTEFRASYGPTLHVKLFENDGYRLKIAVEGENETEFKLAMDLKLDYRINFVVSTFGVD
ncbi:outer arm dynein light chain 1 [Medicago truncatula]|uniref:Outer arm dynein light chain 1 n=1 Tax=Medicago truncatula TaxID=3880 RepID=A0A072TQ89_MEDTR|nr:outer arm dynein light chain 1 [Medicago truncatula]